MDNILIQNWKSIKYELKNLSNMFIFYLYDIIKNLQ